MTANVEQSADNTAQADELARKTREQAEHGGQVVANAVSAMAEVNEASKKIADIIGMVGEIAFQTNLLALNASVEAARAGEQGRGFAVVATEVRNLAQRSASAASEIKTLIGDTVEKVDVGAKLIAQSGESLDEIIEGVSQVSDLVGAIHSASQEQASGINQVNTAIGQMDETTQQNAALVEESSATADTMAGEANTLADLMGTFKVSNDSTGDYGKAEPEAHKAV
jgi:methyl-accepting chemotaxis protein